jgi:hypothetical protein
MEINLIILCLCSIHLRSDRGGAGPSVWPPRQAGQHRVCRGRATDVCCLRGMDRGPDQGVHCEQKRGEQLALQASAGGQQYVMLEHPFVGYSNAGRVDQVAHASIFAPQSAFP